MKHVKIHEEVRLIEGALRSAVYDLPRGTFQFLPNTLTLFLKKNDKKSLKHLSRNEEFKSFYKTLIEDEIIFLEDSQLINNFPSLNLEWKSPFKIKCIIIDINEFDIKKSEKQLNYITLLNIKHIHFNVKKIPSISNLKKLFSLFEGSPLHTIDFLLVDERVKKVMEFINTSKSYSRITKIFINASLNYKQEQNSNLKVFNIDYGKKTNIKLSNFMINISLFTEAQRHHVYFNEKLHIDENGNIKNAPETNLIIGNINNCKTFESFLQVISSDELKKYWNISKGECEVCKSCEFRYMCTDNRIPIKLENGNYYFDVECNYNPYIAKWKGEEGYKTLKESGINISETGTEIDKKYYKNVIQELWGI